MGISDRLRWDHSTSTRDHDGNEPKDDFWDGVATFLRPDLADRVELDSQGGMFAASGPRRGLVSPRKSLTPMLKDPASTLLWSD